MKSDPYASYTHNPFTVNPSVCDLYYSHTDTKLVNGGDDSAVESYDDDTNEFKFLYDASDDFPIRPDPQTQTVTVTGTSGSPWKDVLVNQPAKDDDDFILSFPDPCLDANFVTITPDF